VIALHLLGRDLQQCRAAGFIAEIGKRKTAQRSRFENDGRRHASIRIIAVESEHVPRQIKAEYLLLAILGHEIALDRPATHHVERVCLVAFAKHVLTPALNTLRLNQLLAQRGTVKHLGRDTAATGVADVAGIGR